MQIRGQRHAGCCAVVFRVGGDRDSLNLAFLLLPLAFWLADVTEAVLGSAGAREVRKEVCKVAGRWLLGLVGFAVLGGLSQS